MSVINQKDYLKKYLKIGKQTNEKKKKKQSKNPLGKGLKIIDDDVYTNLSQEIQDDIDAANEDAPQIVAVIDDRPPSMRVDEKTKNKLWQPIGESNVTSSEIKNFKISTINLNKNDNETKSSKSKFCDNLPLIENKSKNIDDFSPRNKLVLSPARKPNASPSKDNDFSSPNRQDEDYSPSRRKDKNYSPCRSKDKDYSPPRRKYEDYSPPRRKDKNDSVLRRKGEDYFPSRRKDKDYSPSRRTDEDYSPPRRKNKDHSPSRRTDEDYSPPRIKDKNDSLLRRKGEDYSPSRRKDKDHFPPRIKGKNEDSLPRRIGEDNSPCRRKDRDYSPLRRKDENYFSLTKEKDQSKDSLLKKQKDTPSSVKGSSPSTKTSGVKRKDDSSFAPRKKVSRWEKDDVSKPETTMSGKKSGLQRAQNLIEDLARLQKQEEEIFKTMSADVSGVNATTVMRRKKQEEVIDPAKEAREKELKEKYSVWGKGLKQVQDETTKFEDQLKEMNKPMARYADDEDLERYLKEQEREGDPMLAYIRKKKKKVAVEQGISEKPMYMGDFMPNRFGIPPGYRWDGVDRSNGYETKWFQTQNSKKAMQDEALMWSTEDM